MIHTWFGASWKPKLIAVMALISLTLKLITALIDGDKSTVPDIEGFIGEVLIVAALFTTRANLVTSEQAKQGAKPASKHR